MKHTIKITSEKAITVERNGAMVAVGLCSRGTEDLRQEVDPLKASMVGMALTGAAVAADRDPDYVGKVSEVSLGRGRVIQVWPERGAVMLCARLFGMELMTFQIGPASATVLACALGDAAVLALDGEVVAKGVRCHGDMCAGGQVACPTPGACGVQP